MHILAFLVILRYIQAKSDGIRHILQLFMHIQAYSEPQYILRHIQNPSIFRGIFRNPVHQETLHMQNFSIFKILAHSEIETYSEAWHIKNPRDVQNQSYFQILGIFKNLSYSEPRYIQNSSIFRTRDIFRDKVGVSKLLFVFLGSFFVFVSFRLFVYWKTLIYEQQK